MFKLRKRSLANTPLYASLLVILIISGFIGVYWSVDKYLAYKNDISRINDRFNQQYQARLKEEMDNVLSSVKFRKAQAERNIEEQLIQKVDIAYVTASHLYSLYKNSLTDSEMREMVKEALRPVRWDNNLGYYFAGEMSTGKVTLVADRPELEGRVLIDQQDDMGNYFIREMIDITLTRGAGLVNYLWNRPESGEDTFEKISFVRYFEPFDWFLGAGVYVADIQKGLQKDVIDRVSDMQFAQFGSVSCIDGNGITLLDFERQKAGRSIFDIYDENGEPFGKNVYKTATASNREGFIKAVFEKPFSMEKSTRLSYVKYYEQWDWIFVTSTYEDEMNAAIELETKEYRNSIFKDIVMFTIIFSLTVVLVLSVAYFYSLRIQDMISLFTDFFKDASDKKIKFGDGEQVFSEFVQLSKYANMMVDDRISKEKRIKKDELRLDTLFNLAIMQDKSLQEIINFALERSLVITDSQCGYVAFVDHDRTINVMAYISQQDEDFITDNRGFTPSVEMPSSTAVVFSEAVPLMENNGDRGFLQNFNAPEKHAIERHLDVPLINNGHVVAIIGVANCLQDYTNFDVQQLTIIQERMWNQIIKKEDEYEMNRLRNLLKSINDSMPSIIIGVDPKCTVMQWNKRAEDVTGLSSADAENKHLSEVYPQLKQFIPKIEEVIRDKVAHEEGAVSWEFKGEKRHDSITIFPLIGQNLAGAVIRIDDITEKARMEDMMVQSEKMLSVGGLAAGMAHEINNPLAGIMQNMQVIEKRLDPTFSKNMEAAEKINTDMDQIAQYIEVRGIKGMLSSIHTSASRAAALVLNMLSFSRKSESILSVENIEVLMEKTLELVSNDYDLKKKFDFRKIVIHREYQENLPEVQCEATNIQQVFLNILKNGAYALSEKKYHFGEQPQLSLRISTEVSGIKVEIEDNGPGIDEETKKRIFEPFYTTKPVGIGTGIGLSISYFIIHEQHKGTLEVLSELGKGAKFIIRLPFQKTST